MPNIATLGKNGKGASLLVPPRSLSVSFRAVRRRAQRGEDARNLGRRTFEGCSLTFRKVAEF